MWFRAQNKNDKQPSGKSPLGGGRRANTSRATTVIKAMSNRQRLEILSHLINGEERTVSELESIVKGLSQSALSQHLGRLRRANIVKARRDSQMVYYSLEDDGVQQIMELLTEIYQNDPVLPNKRQ